MNVCMICTYQVAITGEVTCVNVLSEAKRAEESSKDREKSYWKITKVTMPRALRGGSNTCTFFLLGTIIRGLYDHNAAFLLVVFFPLIPRARPTSSCAYQGRCLQGRLPSQCGSKVICWGYCWWLAELWMLLGTYNHMMKAS